MLFNSLNKQGFTEHQLCSKLWRSAEVDGGRVWVGWGREEYKKYSLMSRELHKVKGKKWNTSRKIWYRTQGISEKGISRERVGGMWVCTLWRKQRAEGDGCLPWSKQQPDLVTWRDFKGISLSKKLGDTWNLIFVLYEINVHVTEKNFC